MIIFQAVQLTLGCRHLIVRTLISRSIFPRISDGSSENVKDYKYEDLYRFIFVIVSRLIRRNAKTKKVIHPSMNGVILWIFVLLQILIQYISYSSFSSNANLLQNLFRWTDCISTYPTIKFPAFEVVK